MMNFRIRIKAVSLAMLMSPCLYLMDGVYFADLLHAAFVTTRKGLPLEMLISADELRQKQLGSQRFILFDARSRVAYNQAHIQGAVLAPSGEAALAEYLKSYPKNTSIVAYCGGGGCQAGAVTVLTLKRLGFSDSKNMEEGLEEWEKKGYPVEK